MLSRKAKYGLKAMLRLASQPTSTPLLVADLAAAELIPKKFLEQILLELKHHGLLQSKKGKGGGYMLARPAGAISMGEIIRALDGPLAPIPCVSQSAYIKCDECLDEVTCGIRIVMKEVRDSTAAILDSRSLTDILAAVAEAAAPAPAVVAVSPLRRVPQPVSPDPQATQRGTVRNARPS